MSSSYAKKEGHKTDFTVWDIKTKKVIHSFSLDGNCEWIHPYTNLEKGHQFMLLAQYDEPK